MEDLDDHSICYWKNDQEGPYERGWWLYLPSCGMAVLRNHTITEHEDGTISVQPSILMHGHKHGEATQRHGYLIRGIWNEC